MTRWIRNFLANYAIVVVLVIGASFLAHYIGILYSLVVLAIIGIAVLLLDFALFRMFVKSREYTGSHREELIEFMHKHKFSVKYLSVTQSKLSNAKTMGILSGKAINFTNNLLERHPLDEIEAVLAHEIGHHKNHDAYWFALLAAVTLTATTIIDAALSSWVGGDVASLALISLVVGTVAFIVVVAPFSKWREGLADQYALANIDDPKALVRFFQRMLEFMKEGGEETPIKPSTLRRITEFHPWIYDRIEFANSYKKQSLHSLKPDWGVYRLLFVLVIPMLFVAWFFQPTYLNFTFSPTNNSSTIAVYNSQIDNFNQEISQFDFINLQFVKYNLYLQQNIQVLDSEKGEVLPGTLLYDDLSKNPQQLSQANAVEIGSGLTPEQVIDFASQFGDEVRWTYTITGTYTIPPHSSISFISHAFIRITVWPTLESYIYLYLFTLAAFIGLMILIKEALQFIFKGWIYFTDSPR